LGYGGDFRQLDVKYFLWEQIYFSGKLPKSNRPRAFFLLRQGIQCQPLGLADRSPASGTIFPDPVRDVLHVETADGIFPDFLLFDMQGTKILEAKTAGTIEMSGVASVRISTGSSPAVS